MKVLDLFCGTKSVANVFSDGGHTVETLDFIPKFNPTYCCDIMQFEPSGYYDIVWASPPCTCYSVASIGRHWKLNSPSEEAKQATKILARTLLIIMQIRPKYWFIENPRGMMRVLPIMDSLRKVTVTYCQYGDTRMKPTDIWTNCDVWKPKLPCKNGDPCHDSAPRGSRKGTRELKNAEERGKIPQKLIEEIMYSI